MVSILAAGMSLITDAFAAYFGENNCSIRPVACGRVDIAAKNLQ